MVVPPGSGIASSSILTFNVSSVRAHRLLPSSAGVIRSRPLRMATTALNPALNIPSRGSQRFAAAPTAVGGPTPTSGRRAGHSSTAPEDAPGPRAGTRAPPRRSTGARCRGCGGSAALRLAGHKGRRERRGSQPGRGGVTSRHSRGGDETRSRSAGLAILAMGVLGRVRRDEDGTRHREPFAAGAPALGRAAPSWRAVPGLDCKKPYRGKNSPGVTVCHDPLLGPAARDTADRLFLWDTRPRTSRAVRLQLLHRRASAWTRSCRLPAHR